MNYQYCQTADEHSIFAPDAFKNSIGKPFKMHLGDVNDENRITEEARMVDAEVSEDGKSVLITVEIPDGAISKIIQGAIPKARSIEIEEG